MIRTESVNFGGSGVNIAFDITGVCPMCEAKIAPVKLSAIHFKDEDNHEFAALTYLCRGCHRAFVSVYELTPGPKGNFNMCPNSHVYTGPQYPSKVEFSRYIIEVSPEFARVYNEAHYAEAASLTKIAGVGYRKSLEFLIKDFISADMSEDERETIRNKFLGSCIKENLLNENIRIAAERAAWIGNDEVHYYRKHTDKDLQDLKRLIDLTVRHIESDLMTKEALEIEFVK